MKHLSALLSCLVLLTALSACQDNNFEIPAEELYLRNFIKTYGLIDPSQDWSVLKQGSVTVTTSAPTDVRVLATIEGKSVILGAWTAVTGTQELTFDCPKEIDAVIVKSSGYMAKVELGGSVSLAPVPSRAIDGSDALPGYAIDNGYYWSNPYVKAMFEKVPEGDPRNTIRTDLMADFSFVSTGGEFVLYPIYMQTGGHDVLGVYWYENGEMKTMDVYDSAVGFSATHDKNAEDGYHNIYFRDTKGSQLTTTVSIDNGAKNIPLEGAVSVTFNRNVELTGMGKASISPADGVTLGFPSVEQKSGSTVITFSYSGLKKNSDYTFTLEENAVKTVDAKDWYTQEEINGLPNQKSTVRFSTVAGATWKEAIFTVEGLHVTCVIPFTSKIEAGFLSATVMGGSLTGENTLAVTNWVVSSDGLSIKAEFDVPDYDTSYRLFPASSIVHEPDGTELDWTAFSDTANSYNVFQTEKKPAEYEEILNFVDNSNLTLDKDNYITDNGTKLFGTSTTFGDDVVTISVYSKNQGESSKGGIKVPSEYLNKFFPVSDECEQFYPFVFPVKVSTTDYTKIFETPAYPVGSGYCNIEVSSKKECVLHIYSIDTEEKYPNLLIAGETKYQEYGGYVNKTKVIRNDTIFMTSSIVMHPDEKYCVYFGKDVVTNVAGFSYQKIKADEAPAESARRVLFGKRSVSKRVFSHVNPAVVAPAFGSRGNGADGEEFGANGSKPTYWPENVSDNGFVRNPRKGAKALSDPNKDGTEVLTHRVSFTLPKDVIFGFYIHNKSGADNITGPGGNAKDYYNYSMSSLNRDMPNSFFKSLDSNYPDVPYFINGWGTKYEGGNDYGDYPDGYKKEIHDKNGNLVVVPESRKYSTALTYTVNVEGHEMRYFSFEDWLDCDFNDIVFLVAPETNENLEIIDGEVDTMPYIFAVEDLGAMESSDLDFNDIVFAAELVPDNTDSQYNWMYVTMLAAGGELEAQLYFNGEEVNGFSGTQRNQEIVSGPYVKNGVAEGNKILNHVNEWFGITDVKPFVNVGDAGGREVGFTDDNLTTIRFKVDKSFSFADRTDFNKGFSVKVRRYDGNQTSITDISQPKALGEAPQMIVLPCIWKWPTERTGIHDAYCGNANYPSFESWVANGYANTDWYKAPDHSKVINSPWTGSQAAREFLSTNTNAR